MGLEFSEDLLFQYQNLIFWVNNITEFVAIVSFVRRLFALGYSTDIIADHFRLVAITIK